MTGRGTEWVSLWDGRRWPGRVRGGLPEFGFGQAPSGLSTRRQLGGQGLSRGGQEPFARLVWKKGQRFAWLYVDEKARPKRTPTDKQLAAVEKALAARKVCAECGPVDHFVRTSDRLCGDCHAAGVTPTRTGEPAAWQVLHDWEQTDATDDASATGDQIQVTPRQENVDAVQRAAGSVARLSATSDQGAASIEDAGERDEQLVRWRDDEAARRGAAVAGDISGQDWPELGRGAA